MDKTYRNILKWGDPQHEEKLTASVLKTIKEMFGFSEADLKERYLPGDHEVKLDRPCRLSADILAAIRAIVGSENVAEDDFSRAYHAHGKFYAELLKLRLGRVDNPPDAVVYPRHEQDVEALVRLCHEHRVALTPFGGHSSVTRALEMPNGGISLDLTRHLNKIVQVSEVNSTATVQAGLYGPAFERYLNQYGAGYTCGHFPQSFEFSTVGGWAAARGAGQYSTGYGKMEDMTLAMRIVTPRGLIVTRDYPASAQGWDLNQIFMGSEGILGVITEVTMQIRRFWPENAAYSSYMFKDFTSAVTAMREIMQSQFGMPHFFRISDPEESDIAFRMKGLSGSWNDRLLRTIGYLPGQRTIMFAGIEGDRDYARFVRRKMTQVAGRHGAFVTGAGPVRKWLEQRYSSAYLRDPLMDLGIMTDTMETAVTWENLIPLWNATRHYIKSRPRTVCMVHISHVYENGANLYFTFLSPMTRGSELAEYTRFHTGLFDVICANHGALSHHHGVGRALGPWMEQQHGVSGLDLKQAIKNYLDPNGIMNPGGTLGLKP